MSVLGPISDIAPLHSITSSARPDSVIGTTRPRILHGMWIVLGVMGGCNFHPSELLARGAVLVHVAHGAHR